MSSNDETDVFVPRDDRQVFGEALFDQIAFTLRIANSSDELLHGVLQRRHRRWQIFRKSRDYILACLDSQKSPIIVDVCRQIGVCERVKSEHLANFAKLCEIRLM